METGLAASLAGLVGFFTIARLTAPAAAAGQRAHRAQNQPLLRDTKPPPSVSPSPSTPHVRLTLLATYSHSHHYRRLHNHSFCLGILRQRYFTGGSTFNSSSVFCSEPHRTLILCGPDPTMSGGGVPHSLAHKVFTSQMLLDDKQQRRVTRTALQIRRGALEGRKGGGVQYHTEQQLDDRNTQRSKSLLYLSD